MNILVNNEVAMTVGGGAGFVDGGNQAAITSVGRHSAGNVCGLTINEFVALPARARISLSFECD